MHHRELFATLKMSILILKKKKKKKKKKIIIFGAGP